MENVIFHINIHLLFIFHTNCTVMELTHYFSIRASLVTLEAVDKLGKQLTENESEDDVSYASQLHNV